MAADDEDLWLGHGWLPSGEHALVRSDGQIWTTHSSPTMFDNLGIAYDGTIWVSIRATGTMHRLVVDGEANP
jgi:hypothetical protein